MVKNLCIVCNKCVRENQQRIFCDVCTNWIHFACTALSIDEYERLSNSDDEWYCQSCLSSLFPFNHIDDDVEYINCINNINYSNQINITALSSLQQFNIINACKIVDKNIDPERNLLLGNVNATGVSYFMDFEFSNLISTKNIGDDNVSILHLNARSLTNKMAEVRKVMLTKLVFLVIIVT